MNLRTAVVAMTCMVLMAVATNGQEATKSGNNAEKNKISKPSRDFLMLEFVYNGWLDAPDSIKTKGFGRGFNGYLCYDFPIKKSHFSFAAGVGISTGNIYLDGQEVIVTDKDSNAQARFVPETINYKRYKVNTTYLEAPFELRFFGNKNNRNKGFKTAVGLRVGTLIGAKTRGREDGIKFNYQTNTKAFLETWRFSTSFRIGYGNFSAVGTYNLTPFYKDLQGPPITPFSIGLCITGL